LWLTPDGLVDGLHVVRKMRKGVEENAQNSATPDRQCQGDCPGAAPELSQSSHRLINLQAVTLAVGQLALQGEGLGPTFST
jgi:hypothetical protein